MKTFLWILVIVAVGYAIYYFYNKNKKTSSALIIEPVTKGPVTGTSISY